MNLGLFLVVDIIRIGSHYQVFEQYYNNDMRNPVKCKIGKFIRVV